MSDDTDLLPDEALGRAHLALCLAARDPAGLGGVVLRARQGPQRDALLACLPGDTTRLHPAMEAEALLGGLDLAQTLAQARPVHRAGLLSRPGWIVLSMAERCPPGLAALLAQAIESGRTGPLLLLDEGAEDDERPPRALTERLACHVALDDGTPYRSSPLPLVPEPSLCRPDRASAGPDVIPALVALAARFGIDTLRAPQFALRAAQALAGRSGRNSLCPGDLAAAAALVYAPRATCLPQDPEDTGPDDTPPPPPPPDDAPDSDGDTGRDTLPDTLLVDAVQAALPPDLLARLSAGGRPAPGAGSGAGQRRKGNRRGRPLPSRRKRLSGQDRLDLTATLRAAAPWQRLRRAGDADLSRRVTIWPSDIHVRRYEDRSDRLLIFAVDASGSAALSRLSEAKGAVELLLGAAYAARDHVALIAFRGAEAELLLPPTRSLVQTKRRLAALPGGGGTPLASALRLAGDTADHARRHGLSPAVALLTDGRANIALDGQADRTRAMEDAEQMARWLAGLGLPGTVLDVGRRPHPALARLAGLLGAHYVPLPRAEAVAMSRVLQDSLG